MPSKKDKEITIKEFADRMAYECIHNTHSTIASFNGYLPVPEEEIHDVPRIVQGTTGREDDVSTVTAATTVNFATVMAQHPFKDNPELEEDSNNKMRPKRRRCPACTTEGRRRLTPKTCFHPHCRDHKYWSGGKWVYGVFYCPEHYHCHYAKVFEGGV
jgi:hypothetical protein